VWLAPRSALAGGFEIPDNGTQAVGRGGAFVAKADDGTAIYHNPAGLARQRGTNVLVNANIFFHSFEFQRIGQFQDDPQDPETSWGQARFPLVKNIAGPFLAPFLAVTSDFSYFDRLTFGLGVYGPPVVGNRTFPLGVENKPAASRYDFVQSRSSIIFPTASAGYRVTPWLDVGLSTHLVLANFDQTTVSYADLGPNTCKNPEDFRCDSRSTLVASGTAFGATLGAMVRPIPSVAFGASFRTPITITANGTVIPVPPRALQDQELNPGDATIALQLPWTLRVGGRYIGMDADFELYDLELDLTYESWGTSQKDGPIVDIPNLGAFSEIQTVVLHRYNDTFGIRGGGAYNIDTGDGILSLRGGAYFDSSATDFAYTRLDFDTLAKVAGTFGLGYRIGAFGFDLSYAAVASIPRLVGTGVGEIRPVNGLKNGQPIGFDDEPLGAVNEGAYRGFTHILSLGVNVSIDGLFGPPRPVRYGNPYEPNYVGEDDEARPQKKPEEEGGDSKGDTDNDEKRPDEASEKKPAPEEEKKKPEKPAPPPPDDDEDDDEDDEEKPLETTKKPPPTVDERPPKKRREWWEELD
jgi:long-chain fatty acid transport protein